MRVLLSFLAIVLCLLFVVGIHEVGHAWAASLLRVKIQKISIGFGRAVFRWRSKSGCEWLWAMWPVGGYVQLMNSRIESVSADEYPFSFDKKPVWVRCVILLSGALANLLVAWFALVFMLVLGYQQTRPVIEKINTPSRASVAGFAAGEQLISIAGRPVSSWRDVAMQLIVQAGRRDVSVMVVDGLGLKHELHLDLAKWHLERKNESLLPAMGITPDLSPKNNEKVRGLPWLLACQQALVQMKDLLYFFLVVLKQVFMGIIPFTLLLGPLGLFTAMVDSFFQGLAVFLYFVASLSLSVALINLFPIPGLDGGSIIYALIEKIRGKPVSVAMEILLHRLIFIAFCLILVQLLLNDLQRYLH